jgi:hypothetical protein
MTEHSIEELKRQYEAAVSRAKQSDLEKMEAGRRYTEKAIAEKLAEFADRGITPGSKVRLTFERWGGNKVYKDAGFLGVEAGHFAGQTEVVFSRLKKDGTPSKSKWRIYSYSNVEPINDDGQDSISGEAE